MKIIKSGQLEKIYQNYFPFSHQECSDDCSKKFSEIAMQSDFVEEITELFKKEKKYVALEIANELYENFEAYVSGSEIANEVANRELNEIYEWMIEKYVGTEETNQIEEDDGSPF